MFTSRVSHGHKFPAKYLPDRRRSPPAESRILTVPAAFVWGRITGEIVATRKSTGTRGPPRVEPGARRFDPAGRKTRLSRLKILDSAPFGKSLAMSPPDLAEPQSQDPGLTVASAPTESPAAQPATAAFVRIRRSENRELRARSRLSILGS